MTTEKNDQLERIADALERLAPKTEDFPNFDNFSAFMWHVAPDYLEPVKITNAVDISLLKGIDQIIRERTNVPVNVSEDPLLSVVKGTGMVLENLKKYEAVLL